MKSGSSSSAQDSSDIFQTRIRARDPNLLQSCTLYAWLGASDLAIACSLFEPLPHSSPPSNVYCESAATTYLENNELGVALDRILSLATEEGFEDGMQGRTSKCLATFLSEHSAAGVQQLTSRIAAAGANQGVAADVVRMLSQIDDARSLNDRVYAAECLLFSPLPLARDAGAVALVDLANECGIPALRRAIEAEPVPGLQADMQASLDELIKGTDAVRSPEA